MNDDPIELRMPPAPQEKAWIAKWLAVDGAHVKPDQPLFELETPNATMDFPSPATGQLEQVAQPYDQLTTGQLIARIHTQT